MTERHFIIKLTEELVVSGSSGKLTRNSNGTQWLDVELDGWVLPEGAELYIELSHKNSDTELTTIVGPLNLIFNLELGRYITLAPPELISTAGKWNYSIELRFDIGESNGDVTKVSKISVADEKNNILYNTTTITGQDTQTGVPTEITVKTDKDGDVISSATVVSGSGGKGILTYNSLTSAVYSLEVIDTVTSNSPTNSFTKETELLTATRVMASAIAVGHTAEEVLEAAVNAKQSELNTAVEAENAWSSAASSEQSANIAQEYAEKAAQSEAEIKSAAQVINDSMNGAKVYVQNKTLIFSSLASEVRVENKTLILEGGI